MSRASEGIKWMDENNDIKNVINALEAYILNPSSGLPEDVFLFVSRITPMINVDLLIRNGLGRTLLTWREDRHHAAGWHVPGGIIRLKETFADRLRAVARTELRAEVEFKQVPLAINEIILPERRERGHFISLLYECSLVSSPDKSLACRSENPFPGQWMWHEKCPVNIIAVHEIYRKYM